jgi:hypothetical protein
VNIIPNNPNIATAIHINIFPVFLSFSCIFERNDVVLFSSFTIGFPVVGFSAGGLPARRRSFSCMIIFASSESVSSNFTYSL